VDAQRQTEALSPELEPRRLGRLEVPRLGQLGRRTRDTLLTYVGVVTVLGILIVYFAFTQEQFFTYENLLNILDTNAVLLVVSVGLTFTLLVGGFDLSVGGVLALSGVILAKLLQGGVPTGVAMVIVIAGACLIPGIMINGFTIAKLGVNFFVVTLGVLVISRGIALAITNGASQGLYEEEFLRDVGAYRIGGDVSMPVVIALFVLIVATLFLRYTGYGRMVYAVGGNSEAARLAGINVTLVRMSAYAISATLAGLAGVMEAGRLAAAAPDTDQGIEFTAAAAVLLGGTSFIGGQGTMFGTFLGVIFLGVLQNGLIISSISVYYQGVITGVVLIASVTIDRLRRTRAGAV
jgi:ribose transport system permease protein